MDYLHVACYTFEWGSRINISVFFLTEIVIIESIVLEYVDNGQGLLLEGAWKGIILPLTLGLCFLNHFCHLNCSLDETLNKGHD